MSGIELAQTKIMDIRPDHRFSLDAAFLSQFVGRQPEFGPVGEITYRRTYARPLPDGGSEDYWQTLERVVNGVYTVQKWHCRTHNLPWRDGKAQRSAQSMFKLMWDFKFTPPGRGLWIMGTSYIETHGAGALNNCGFATTANIDEDFSSPFTFLMDFSMLGVGVGGDCRGAGKVIIQHPRISNETYVVSDDREGWVALARRILEAYAGKDTIPAHIDYSLVRPYGAPIKGFGGTAAGPEPLRRLVAEIQRILNPLITKPITSEAIVDLFDVIGVCVVAGNVRRSAIIMFGDPEDSHFLDLKNPAVSQAEMMSHRWASNNSVLSRVGMDYKAPAHITARSGEPGYLWLENARHYGRMGDTPDHRDLKAMGTNPCSEQVLEDKELCCLVETFPSRHATYEEFQLTLKFAYLYAKTVTLVPTHNADTNAVLLRNRRIGLSQSGIVQSFARHGRRKHLEWSAKGYSYLTDLDKIYSDWLCVPRSKRRTSVKPSGTVSLLPGVTPGIHYEHSQYYYRTIRVAANSPLVALHAACGYRIEDDLYDKTGGTKVIYFPVKAEWFDRSKRDVTMWEQLENAAQMQAIWADNSVSCTVTFKPEEAKDIARALELYESRLKSISFLPLDHEYPQAPYIEITEEEYLRAAAQVSVVDYSVPVQNEQVERFCSNDVCEIKNPAVAAP